MNTDKSEINIEDKKKYIYNNIDSITNTKNIIHFITNSDINYSTNQNGIHVNITVLDETVITGLYNIIFYEINEKIDDDKYLKEYNKAIKKLNNKNIKKNNKNNNNDDVDDNYESLQLTDIQKEMINLLF